MKPAEFDPKDIMPSKWFFLVPFLFYFFQAFNFSNMEPSEILWVHFIMLVLGLTFVGVGLGTSRIRHKNMRRVIFLTLTLLFLYLFISAPGSL